MRLVLYRRQQFTGLPQDSCTEQVAELNEVRKMTAPRGTSAEWRVTAFQLLLRNPFCETHDLGGLR